MRGQGDFETMSLDDKESKNGIINEILKRHLERVLVSVKNKYKLGDKMLLTFTKFAMTGAWKRRQLRNYGPGRR